MKRNVRSRRQRFADSDVEISRWVFSDCPGFRPEDHDADFFLARFVPQRGKRNPIEGLALLKV